MNKIKINEIEICYDNNKTKNIDSIRTIIENNYELFLELLGQSQAISLVPTEEDKVVYIADFDKTFYEVVNKVFNSDDNKDLLDNPDLLPALYVESLVRKSSSNQMSLVQSNSNVTDEELYSLIAYIYFKKTATFDDFVDYLKDKKDIDKILNWTKNETRFNTYNYLLEVTINFLKQSDFEFFESISDIVYAMFNQSIKNIFMQHPEKEVELPSITAQEFDNLFYKFLDYINAPESWKQMYDELKSSDRISFETLPEDFDNSMCYKDDNDILRVLVSTDGTIKCFSSFVHEFAHYVSMQDIVKVSQFSISEFPSIFFQKLAAEFLRNSGYNKDIVDKVESDRNKNNQELYSGLSTIFNDISRFIRKGPILKEDKVLYWENHFRLIQETKEKIVKLCEEKGQSIPDLDFLEQQKIDIDKEVDKECDLLIDGFIQNGLLILNGYQYLLGTYLAEEVLQKSIEDETIIPRMINVTNNLSNMNLKDVLAEFDMQNLFDDTKEKGKVKLKKTDEKK